VLPPAGTSLPRSGLLAEHVCWAISWWISTWLPGAEVVVFGARNNSRLDPMRPTQSLYRVPFPDSIGAEVWITSPR
jgi:hypothetical protein